MKYAFWNNKGGTGKTTLAFQTICEIALQNPQSSILVIDCCPQANLSELFLGSLQGNGGNNLLQLQSGQIRKTIGGYFERRLPTPYTPPAINSDDFISKPSSFNSLVPNNIDLLAGDPLLELQANTMYTMANVSSPVINNWSAVIQWLSDFLARLSTNYEYIFFDLNPSFALYTQIALAATDRLILPVMADDSSRRAIQNAFSLVYGLRLPSPIYAQHAFSNQLLNAGSNIPQTHLIVKNRITQYMGPASGYAAILNSIDNDVSNLIIQSPSNFTFTNVSNGFCEIRDFQTCGVVAAACGMPFSTMTARRYNVFSQRIQVNREQLDLALDHIQRIVTKL
ncbi:AAA family ATPase [Pectobacterium carotovorum]|uniref:ParA family protein n=1 Tax=Pectobacterium TaxID=122277 RepID=UPI001968F91A|nr:MULTISPECIES: AAA family ATPase [Pectobacterium]MBN3054614.1 AAA family ATPase [Pectobacterium brasiliense]MDX6915773.1 AAA family ATPase [Pectobacterium carotovorum]MDY4348473.1 AAA family ATPase [Pectobacterium brasiliense]